MIKRIRNSLISAAGLAIAASAASAATHTLDYTDNAAGYYFVEPGQSPTQSGSTWYRGRNQDWSWTHDGVAGVDAVLNIGAWDVDNPCSFKNCEQDRIFAWDNDGLGWLDLGLLTGTNNAFSFSAFDIWNAGSGALRNEIGTGLRLRMDIDELRAGWLVTLSKSVITTNGSNPGTPVPSPVPLPAAGWVMITGLAGLAALRRGRK